MQDTSIFIQPEEPKRHFRSNMKMYILLGCVFLLSVIVFRIWITRDTVTQYHSENTILSMQILKSSSNLELLDQNLGNPAILGPLSLDYLLSLSNHNIALHFDAYGQISEATIDTELSDNQISYLANIGLYSVNSNGRALISVDLIEVETNPSTRFTLHALNPFFDGKIRGANESGWLSIHKKGLTLHNFGEKADIKTDLFIAEGTEMVALLSSTDANMETAALLEIHKSSVLNEVIGQLNQPWKFALSQNEEGDTYFSLLIQATFDINQLAQIAQYIASFDDLSTTALTLNDNTRVEELRTSLDQEISITSESNTHFLHINQGDSGIHLTQTPDALLITNFDSTPTLENLAPESSCKPNAHTYTDLSLLFKSNQGPVILNTFENLAINNRSIYLCW